MIWGRDLWDLLLRLQPLKLQLLLLSWHCCTRTSIKNAPLCHHRCLAHAGVGTEVVQRHCCSSALSTRPLPQKDPVVLVSMFWKHSRLLMLIGRSLTFCCFPLRGCAYQQWWGRRTVSAVCICVIKNCLRCQCWKAIKAGAEGSPQEPLWKTFFPFIIPKCGNECVGVKRKSELLEKVNVKVGYWHKQSKWLIIWGLLNVQGLLQAWSFSCLSWGPYSYWLRKNTLQWHTSAGQPSRSTGNHHLLRSLQKPEVLVRAVCCVKSIQGTRSPMVVPRTRIILSMESPRMHFAAVWYGIRCTHLTECICGEDGFTAHNQSVECLQQENSQL